MSSQNIQPNFTVTPAPTNPVLNTASLIAELQGFHRPLDHLIAAAPCAALALGRKRVDLPGLVDGGLQGAAVGWMPPEDARATGRSVLLIGRISQHLDLPCAPITCQKAITSSFRGTRQPLDRNDQTIWSNLFLRRRLAVKTSKDVMSKRTKSSDVLTSRRKLIC